MNDMNTKTEFKWFSFPQYHEEEEYLSNMHSQGWKLVSVVFPGFYNFTKCEPEHVSYRLDYNLEGLSHKDEYVQLFSDCGWEYLFNFVGYSYFRKNVIEGDMNEDIFCDDESRLDMLKRVFKGRLIPLLIIFFLLIIPQFLMNTFGYARRGDVQNILSFAFFSMGLVYLIFFGMFTVQYYQFEKKVRADIKKYIPKYIAIFSAIAICTVFLIFIMCLNCSSKYTITDNQDGFTIDADRLNKKVVMEYDLEAGDEIAVSHTSGSGEIYLSIGEPDTEPIFYGNTFSNLDYFTVTVHKNGHYEILCKGNNAKGQLEISINKGDLVNE